MNFCYDKNKYLKLVNVLYKKLGLNGYYIVVLKKKSYLKK